MRGEGYIYKHVNAYKTKMYLTRRSIVKDSINVNATRLLSEMKKGGKKELYLYTSAILKSCLI